MAAMSEPAYVEPDEHGDFHLLIDGERKTFRIEYDESGRAFLTEILPYESLPQHVRDMLEEQERNPKPYVRRPRPSAKGA